MRWSHAWRGAWCCGQQLIDLIVNPVDVLRVAPQVEPVSGTVDALRDFLPGLIDFTEISVEVRQIGAALRGLVEVLDRFGELADGAAHVVIAACDPAGQVLQASCFPLEQMRMPTDQLAVGILRAASPPLQHVVQLLVGVADPRRLAPQPAIVALFQAMDEPISPSPISATCRYPVMPPPS